MAPLLVEKLVGDVDQESRGLQFSRKTVDHVPLVHAETVPLKAWPQASTSITGALVIQADSLLAAQT